MIVLIPSNDHQYRVAETRVMEVVYNTETKTYSEYGGFDYLEDNEIVVSKEVLE